jgi:nicotinamidase-related amidase
MTATQRFAAIVPRMNRVLASARQFGIPVIWAPTDVASPYVGTPPRERAIAIPRYSVPTLPALSCQFTAKAGPCMCGPGIACVENFGWDRIQPDLVIDDKDWMVSGTEELYSICKKLGITHLIYMGIHTNACVFNREEGIGRMSAAGLNCMLARDVTDAITRYDPKTGYTPDDGTAQSVADIERAGVPSTNMVEVLKRAGAWKDDWIVDAVHISPWGTGMRPYQFYDPVTVTLTASMIDDADIRYTLDGSEPKPDSRLYHRPLRFAGTTRLHAAAFRNGSRVSLLSEGYFAHLCPIPPKPERYLDEFDVVPMRSPWPPKANTGFNGGRLSIRGHEYARGFGVRAPFALVYKVQPEWDRFVALAGVDDDPYRQSDHAYFLGNHSRVQFRVLIDGRLASESPVLRLSQEPWRFDVKIPAGSRLIDLVATDAGSPDPLDLADWVDAGFLLKK